MIITISGSPGSGKSTVADIVADKLGMRRYSVGGLMREMAAKRGMTILGLSRLAEKDKAVDDELDSRQRQLGKEDGIVVDSRLGFHFIPNSFKVFLHVSPKEAARRIFAAGRKGERKEEGENITLAKTFESIRKRKASERLRYKKLYGIDPYRKAHYDAYIVTTRLSPGDVAERIVKAAKHLMK
ncbi:cytidylate kinase family protein [Candidatus Woesearchaeota archaeon]|nr:cytidylate kinase family protein [Candidatus Woesearchaeota archaeon]